MTKTFAVLISVLALSFVLTACGSTSPTVPVERHDAMVIATIAYEGVEYTATMDTIVRDIRSCQAIKPGTNMTVAQMKVWLAVQCAKSPDFPAWIPDCLLYKMFYAQIKNSTDATMYAAVADYEAKGYDWPDTPPAPTPLC
jgi:hypothetical protein